MKGIRKAFIKDGWVVCYKCGHKLGRVVGKKPTGIEIKCHSCKELNVVSSKKDKVKIYTQPHCIHCKYYKQATDICVVKLASYGLRDRAKPTPKNCSSFVPKEEYKENYKGVVKYE